MSNNSISTPTKYGESPLVLVPVSIVADLLQELKCPPEYFNRMIEMSLQKMESVASIQLTFGRHKGKTVLQTLMKDPYYVLTYLTSTHAKDMQEEAHKQAVFWYARMSKDIGHRAIRQVVELLKERRPEQVQPVVIDPFA